MAAQMQTMLDTDLTTHDNCPEVKVDSPDKRSRAWSHTEQLTPLLFS
jgi:hypothetical protein